MNTNIELSKKKIGILTIVLAALSALSPFSIDTYAPAMPTMALYFGSAISEIELSMTIYIMGYAIGQFFGGPLSDNFGRRPIVFIGLGIFIISSFLLSICDSIAQLYTLRFIQALGGGFSIVVSMAITRDLFSGSDLAKRISYISMFMMAAPLIAPAVGTILIKIFSWKAIFTFLTLYSILVITLIGIFIPETRKNNNKNKENIFRKTASAYISVFTNSKAMSLILAAALGFAGMYTFITGSSNIYIEHFHMSLELFPILFGSNVILVIIMGAVNVQLLKHFEPQKILNVGLLIQLFAGLSLFLIMLNDNAPFILVFSLIVIFVGILGIIFGNANALVLQMYPNSSGATMAVIGVCEFSIAAITGLLLHYIQDGTILAYGIMMFACTSAANIAYRLLRRI